MPSPRPKRNAGAKQHIYQSDNDHSILLNLDDSSLDTSKLTDINAVNENGTPEDKIFCISNCKLGGKDKDNMVCCCTCNNWFHIECINKSGTEPVNNIWNCCDCKRMPQVIMRLVDEIQALKTKMFEIMKQNNNILHTLKEVKKENISLKELCHCKQDTVAGRNVQQATEVKVKEPSLQPNHKAPPIRPSRMVQAADSNSGLPHRAQKLLLGDVSVCDVSSSSPSLMINSNENNDLLDTYNIIANKSTDSTQEVIISTRMNDCISEKSSEQIIKDFDVVLKEAKRVSAGPVKIASLCLSSDQPGCQSKINKVNKGLSDICENLQCVFIDHTMNFTFLVLYLKVAMCQILITTKPISVLNCVSKIIEKHVHKHFYEYLNQNELLSSVQSGFRPQHSCQTCLTSL